jgi:hypothetical protein
MGRNVTAAFSEGWRKQRINCLLVAVCPQWAAIKDPDAVGFFNSS